MRIQLFLLFVAGHRLVSGGSCPKLQDPAHGSVRYYSEFNMAAFLCEYGYTLHGSMTTICFNGKWSSDVPQCLPADSAVAHGPDGAASNWTRYYEEGTRVRQYRHYTTAHSPTVTSPTVEPLAPKIDLTCHVPFDIPNGFVVLLRTQKHRVVYMCKRGFRPNGRSSASCEEGAWSSPPPSCIPHYGGEHPATSHSTRQEAAVNPCVFDYGGCDQICVNNDGKPACQCLYGYTSVGKQCVDIDECATKNPQCHRCQNTPGKYRCLCRDGFKPAQDQMSCVDINECSVDTGGCQEGCRNTEGSYNCYCSSPGATLASDGRSCILDSSRRTVMPSRSVVTCTRNNGGCSHTCRAYAGAIQCYCPQFYKLDTDNKTCIVADHPSRTAGVTFRPVEQNPCRFNNGRGPCEDTCHVGRDGRYWCSCRNPGMQLHSDRKSCIDKDECQESNFGCMHICHNTLGSAYCSCREGYQLLHDGKTCIDINECDTPGVCDGECFNTVGSYRCSSTDEEISSSGDGPALWTPTGVEDKVFSVYPSQVCPEGMRINPAGICGDIDECREGSSGCSQTCENTDGSYRCSCRKGYRLSADGKTCEDIDECRTYRDYRSCSDICTNLPGTYRCSCNPGRILLRHGQCQDCRKNSYKVPEYELCEDCPRHSHTNGTGKASLRDCICDAGFVGYPAGGDLCEDINECDQGHLKCSHVCVNTIGSAYCACRPGFTLAADATTCVDIDECAERTHACDQDCVNTVGSYECLCKAGYELSHEDKRSCADVNECAVKNGGCTQGCVNIPGGYYCSCDPGYRIASDLRTCIGVTCPALVEVAHGRRDCSPNMTADSAQIGTWCTIRCKKGYVQEGSRSIHCLQNGNWSGSLQRCVARSCPALPDPDHGKVFPRHCLSDTDNTILSRCTFKCDSGYRLNGKIVNTCQRDGTWKHEAPVCSKLKADSFITCPQDVVVSLPTGSDTVLVDLPRPLSASVNLDSVEVRPKWIENYKGEFPFGTSEVTYIASDPYSGTEDNCSFVVEVQDNDPPKIVKCPGTVVAYATALEGVAVIWDEPEFDDNVEVYAVKKFQLPGSVFTVGEHTVHYVARDMAGNEATCQFKVHVKRKECIRPREIEHGELECYDWIRGVVCEPVCDDGYAFPSNVSYFYSCDLAGVWEPRNWIPQCSEYKTTQTQDCLPGSEYFDELEGQTNVCVECPPGMYWAAEVAKCFLCERGFYQDEFGQTSCKPCPATSPQTLSPLLDEQCFA